MSQYTEYDVTLSGGQTQYFKFTLPTVCNTVHQWLKITLITLDTTGGQGEFLVKSSNQNTSSWPNLADYTYEFGLHGMSLGQDWNRDATGGVFFWKFSPISPSNALAILNSYAGHTFNQADTYYILLYDTGSLSNQYRMLWQCY